MLLLSVRIDGVSILLNYDDIGLLARDIGVGKYPYLLKYPGQQVVNV